MPRPIADLVGLAEAAEILGVHAPSVNRLRVQGRLPMTVATLAATPVWRKEDIEAYRAGKPFGRVRPLKIAGTAEAAVILAVNKSQVGRWRRAGRFPAPAFELRAGPIWWITDVTKFKSNKAKGVN